MNKKSASCQINLLYEKHIINQNNIYNINYYKDRFEIDCIFNKKGECEVKIFGNLEREKNNEYILEYKVIEENDSYEQLSFPKSYSGK